MATDVESPCVISPYKPGKRGYPRKRYKGKAMPHHRVVYMEAYGDVPPEVKVRHRCDNKRCINLDHLEHGTQAQNIADMFERNENLYGENRSDHKLTNEQVEYAKTSPKSGRQVALELGVSRSLITAIRRSEKRKRVV